LVGFTISGFVSGLVRNICSLGVPVLGIWMGFRKCDVIAPVIDRLVHNYQLSAGLAFFMIVSMVWLGLRGTRKLLLKLWDWGQLTDLDQFLGGLFGLAKGFALVWVALAACLTVFPPSIRLIQTSQASVQVLALAEQLMVAKPQSRATGRPQQQTVMEVGELDQFITQLEQGQVGD